MATVEIKNLVKCYDNTEVIHNIDAFFENGEFVVVVGPSGCGKSTILRMIAGLEKITGGQILIGGSVVNELEPKDRNIAMVFQNYALYPHMTVEKNMAYGLKLQKVPKEERKRRVQEAADMLELSDFLKRKPKALSGGQRQRVAMGRAIVRNPEVFLFDEPLSNLDAKLRQQMRVELNQLHANLKTTMVYVTHDQIEAMTLADKIVVMNGGYIEQIGTPAEIYHNPATLFVAGFIGSPPMNLLSATKVADDAVRLSNGIVLKCAVKGSQKDLIVGIRPEKLKLLGEQAENSVRINIDFHEKLGANDLLYASIGDNQFIINTEETSQAELKTCWTQFPPDQLYFFNPESGKRI